MCKLQCQAKAPNAAQITISILFSTIYALRGLGGPFGQSAILQDGQGSQPVPPRDPRFLDSGESESRNKINDLRLACVI
jgi:hypothetical protein